MKIKANILTRLGAAAKALRGFSDPYDRYFVGPDHLNQEDATSPYRQVSVVYACVRKRAKALGQMPLRLSTGDDVVVESGPAVELTEQPHPKLTRRKFWHVTSSYLDLSGAAYWWFATAGGDMADGAQPINCMPFPAWRIKPRYRGETLPGEQCEGVQDGWWYRTNAGAWIELPLEEIHPVVSPDYERGLDCPLSVRHAVNLAVQQYFKADVANVSSLDNDVAPSGILNFKTNLSDPQRQDLREQVNDRYTGVLKRRKLMFAEGEMDFHRIQNAFAEMEFTELKKMSRTDICAGYDVPPATIGYYEDSNYAHANAAHELLWDSILGDAEWLAEEWTDALASRNLGVAGGRERRRELDTTRARSWQRRNAAMRAAQGGGMLYAWFDAASIGPVQRMRLASVDQLDKWLAMGVPLNDILRSTDAPFEEQPWGDTWYKPMSLVDVQEDLGDFGPPTGEEPDPADPDDGPDDPPAEPKQTPARSTAPTHVRELTESQLDQLHQQWWNTHLPLQREMRKRVAGHYNRLRNETIANLRKRLKGMTPEQLRSLDQRKVRDLIGEVLFDLIAADKALRGKARPIIVASFRLGGQQSMDDAAAAEGKAPADADPFNIDGGPAREAIRQRVIQITDINDTLAREIREQLAEGLAQGESATTLAERLQRQFDVSSKRAKTIARTEVASSVERGQHLGRLQAGVPMKSWLHSRKETGRQGHISAERVYLADPIDVDEAFVISSEKGSFRCQHPRDTSLPAGEVINCGCTTISRYPDDTIKDARLINALIKRGPLTHDQLTARDAKQRKAA
jgi:hypothetical protein